MGIFAGMLSVTGSALADDSATMEVTASVAASCEIGSTGMAFGAYNPIVAGDVDATATVTVTCTSGYVTGVQLNEGLHADAGSAPEAPLRRVMSGINFLDYQLYSDAGRSIVWGGDVDTDVAHTGTGAPVALTVYGRIPTGQIAAPIGSYADTITALVVF